MIIMTRVMKIDSTEDSISRDGAAMQSDPPSVFFSDYTTKYIFYIYIHIQIV